MDSKTVELSENSNPNISHSSPASKSINSPLTRSAKSKKSAPRNLNLNPNPTVCSPRNRIRERKFVVAKKKKSKKENGVPSKPAVDCKCKEKFGGNMKKCLCVAYETLRASQEEFFKRKNGVEESEGEEETEKPCSVAQKPETGDWCGSDDTGPRDAEKLGKLGCSVIKRRRDKLMEDARSSVPECGKVMHLVKAFEQLLSIPKAKESDEKEIKEKVEETDEKKKALKWALPGLQPPPKVPETQESISSFCPSDLFLTSENLGLDFRASVSSSWDSQGSVSSRTSNGGRRSRRNSTESCESMGSRRWKKKKQVRITNQKPFNLRTEQRGRAKEEEFMKKMEEMMMEEEKQRIPIAQGLPWTTDEPENLIRPPVKENTRPTDLKLHTDMRAVERAEFDNQVAEKWGLIEQYKMERERQQKLAEEEEVRRLRRELVPKAQPMPYFDRPFIPRRSTRNPTIPREPKFHIPHQKKIKCMSWRDIGHDAYH